MRQAALLFALALLCEGTARADEPPPVPDLGPVLTNKPPIKAPPSKGGVIEAPKPEGADYVTPRYEPAGFPLIGGNSDIGFQFGGVATLTRFEDGIRPYRWNMDVLLTASLKDSPSGTEVAQQSYLWQWDLPELFGGRLRLNPLIAYQRTVNQGYYGLGNASSPDKPAVVAGEAGRYFQYIHAETRIRQLARITIEKPYQFVVAAQFRRVDPSAYGGSKLDQDSQSTPDVRGVETLGLPSLATGLIYDTRDNEIFPHRGAFHQIGIKYTQGLPVDRNVQYGEGSAQLVWYAHLISDIVFGTRVITDFEFGNVPFYDLYKGGVFAAYDLPGGASGVRGVPSGRYLGPIKAIANAELRALLVGFRLFGQSFKIGGDAFVDVGRIWSDYSFNSPLDGSGLGLKYGAGLGGYLLWGQAALFRIEVAYSPDAAAENPGFPLGIYVEDGTMF